MALPLLLGASLALPFAGRIARAAFGLARRRPALAAAAAGGAGLAAFGAQQAVTMGGGTLDDLGRRRRRRRKALTDSDLRTMHEISSSISKKAAETFINQRVRRG